MKNVYITITLFLSVTCLHSQDIQNANWFYGDHQAITFLPNANFPQPVSGSAMYSDEGCASVSDINGNLLFYTNGETVWDANNNIMPNGNHLKGDNSSTQSAVIVARPGYPGHYYIVTISGVSGSLATRKRGLHYSEVDMALNNGLGDIISNKKNIPLKDDNGVAIDEQWTYNGDNNRSEKLTSTFHGNGTDYWVVTDIKSSIYSYWITSAGIVETPVVSNSPFYWGDIGQIRISPDGQRIAEVNRQPLIGLGTFNNQTGEAAFTNNIYSSYGSSYSVEFSPNSQILYVGTANKTLYTNGTTSLSAYSWPSGNRSNALQRAINGKIYVGPGNPLGIINDPNNISNPGFSTVSGLSSTELGFPQWVYSQTFSCFSLTLSSEPNTNYMYFNKSNITTTSNYTIASGKDITMKASEYILLTPNTYIAPGSVYLAMIQECSGLPVQREERFASTDTFDEEATDLSSEKAELFTLAPNPSSSRVTLTSSKEIQSVTITSLEGKIMYNHSYKGQTTAELDVQSFSQGYYMVSITTIDGEIETQKLIKN